MSEEKFKEYTNGEITIVWKPAKCFHSEVCVKTLPQVYKPSEKPWIQVENATTEQLKDQVSKCPSGALTFYVNGEDSKSEAAGPCQVQALKNGPLMISGDLLIKGKDGEITEKSNKTAFCRCGASSNKPYCDGSHRKINFEG